ncbi:hypothetical protein vseg_015367 [Gypsophila vaccaria]
MDDDDIQFHVDLNEEFVDTDDTYNRDTVNDSRVNELVPETQAAENEAGQCRDLIREAVQIFDSDLPTVVDITSPEVGMVFTSGDEFAAFTYSYAYKRGFELFIRTNELKQEYKEKGLNRRSCKGKAPEFFTFKRLRLTCKKGGECKHRGSNVTGCKFFVDARIKQGKSMMEITTCNLEHNHVMTPEYRRFMVSYHVIRDYFKKRMSNNDVAEISLVTNYNSLELERGGHENAPFIALEDYFQKMKAENPDFFYAIQRDTEGHLLNVFWADSRCRAAFKSFPDVVTYDTRFSCNKFQTSFSAFIGVNHHGKSTFFAAGLISSEDTDTFVWVFERWLECMGKPPAIMITDQDKAIGEAIRIVFGEKFPHRLCLWHIMRNAARNLGRFGNWSNIKIELTQVMHDSLDACEFDEAWTSMIEKYHLKDNPWIKETYEIRQQWVPAYWRDTFCAGMSSTQRSEQQNLLLKQFVNIETGLGTFLTQFENAAFEKVNEENRMNFECIDRPVNKLVPGCVVAEEIFHRYYTNSIFKEVQKEVKGLIHTNVVRVGKIGSYTLYRSDERVVDPPWKEGRKSYDVNLDVTKGDFKCTCKLFEFKGNLCRHIMACLGIEYIDFIPDKYILDRWRKDIVRGYEHIRVGYYDLEASARVKQSMKVSEKNDYITGLASHDDQGVQTIKSARAGDDRLKVRLQRKENDQRHMMRNVTPQVALKDPVDKRGVERGKFITQKTVRKTIGDSSKETPSKRTRFDL